MEPLIYPDLEDLRRKWQSPETSATLERHMAQYFRFGIIDAYIARADNLYPEIYGEHYAKRQEQISRLVRSELYLVATRLFMKAGDFYLERVNEETGFSVSEPCEIGGSVGTMIPVFRTGESSQSQPKIIEPFTESQVEVVVRNAHELEEMGLHRPLYPPDSRYYDGLEL